MSKILSLRQSIDETVRLLQLEKYQNYRDVCRICMKQIAQARILELIDLGEDKDTIAAGTGLDEKTIRFQRDGDQAPKSEHLGLLEDYLRRVKRRHDKESSR